MNQWQERALEIFPELSSGILQSDDLYDVWRMIESKLLQAFESHTLRKDFFRRVMLYLAWCANEQDDTKLREVVRHGFLEDLGRNQKYWPILPELFTKQEFLTYQYNLKYALSDIEAGQLDDVFYKR